MLREISLSDARKRLSEILREIEADPGAGYRILVRKRVIAELRSPAPARRKNPGATMLKLAMELEKLSSPARRAADGTSCVTLGSMRRRWAG
jgi:antitoxin (DNA-binding transcriptional repressor) of toxin-antitoxin stability system